MTIALGLVSPGSIGNFTDLVGLLRRYMDRTDLDDDIGNFVVLIEAEANRVLRSINQEKKDIWVIGDEEYTLPADFRRMRKMHIEGQPDRPLDEISPVAAPMRFSGEAGIPLAYWIEGRVLTLAPPPVEPTAFRVTYWTRITPLNNDTQSNWLLQDHPDVYVWGVIREAAAYIRDPDALDYASGRFSAALDQLRVESRNDRFGGGPLSPSGPRQVRGARC